MSMQFFSPFTSKGLTPHRLLFAEPKLKRNRTRLLQLLGLVTLATIALAATVSAANSVRELILDLGLSGVVGSVSQPSQPKAALNNSLLTPAPQGNAMTVERRGHTATRLADGRVFIVGGENTSGVLNQAEIFDPTTGTFSSAATLSNARTDQSATQLTDGRVLIAGGRGAAGPLTTCEIFDPATGTFASGPAMNVARAGHSATLFSDGRIFIAGGDQNGSAEIFDPATGAFTLVGTNLSSARSMHSATQIQSGRVLIVGGRDAGGNAVNSVEIFDTTTSTFSAVASVLKVARVQPHLRVLFDGKVQIIGGSDDGSMEIYDPLSDTIGAYAHVIPESDPCAGLPTQVLASQTRAALFHNGQTDPLFDRAGQTINEMNGQALVAGGSNSSGAVLNSFAVVASSSASITTDKLDYAPGEAVLISGRGFQPGETVRLKIHEDPHTPQERGFDAVADADGNFTGTYLVMDYDLNMKFVVGARGLSSGMTAQTTFTDNRVITAATVNGGATTTVAAGATITAAVTVDTTTSGGGGENWFSTSWRFATTSPGATFNTPCADTPDHTTAGTFTESFSTTAPTTPGTYNAYFLAWRTAGCGNNPSNLFVLPNAIIVEAAPTKLAFAVQPTNTNKDATITPAVTVRIESATGSLVTTSTRNVSLAIGTNPGGGTLGGTTTVAAVGGIATFSNLSIDNAGTGYTLVASSTLPAPALTTATSTAFNVNKLDQSITFAALANKTYGDAAFVVSATGGASGNPVTFAAAPAGVCTSSGTNGSTITIVGAGGCTVTASQAGNSNYNAAPNVDQSFTVDLKTLTASIIGNPTKPYDSTANATLTPANFSLSGLVGSDSFTVTKTTGSYNSANVATATTVTTSLAAGDFTPGVGTLASNYTLPTSASGAGQINKADATIVVNGYTGIYDGAAHGATGSATGVLSEALAGLDLGASFTNVPGGTANWTFTDVTGNYNDAAGSAAIVINKADATIVVNGYTGIYDGAAHGASGSATGVLSEALAGLDLGASFTNVPGGTANWTFTDVTGNYNDAAGSAAIVINKADATIVVNGYTGIYDGAAHGASGSATGVLSEALAGLDLGASFTNVPGGTANWTFTDVTGNYNDAAGSAAIVINKASSIVTVTCPGTAQTYTGAAQTPCTAEATGVGMSPLDVTASLIYGSNINVGTATADGSWLGDINHTGNTGSATFEIAKATLTITAVTNTKPYDGNNTAAAIPTVSGLQGTDTVTGLVEVYDNKNAGSGKTLSVSAYTVNDSNGGNNYDVHTTSNNTGVINTVALNITAVANTKLYDGNTSAGAIPTVLGLQGTDTVSGLSEAYDTKHAGSTKTLSVTAYTVNDGNSGNNYDVHTFTSNLGVINVAPLTINAVVNTKVYDGTVSAAAMPTVTGLQGSDTVTDLVETYDNKNVGMGKTLTVVAYTINDGNSGANYSVNAIPNAAGAINKRPITVTAVANSKIYNGNTSSSGIPTVTSGNIVAGDTGNFTQTFDTPFVGTGKTLTPAGSVTDGNGGNNYEITFAPVSTGVITTSFCFDGFLSPIGGSVETFNGGSFAVPVKSFKLGSTIPVKFAIRSWNGSTCGSVITTGIHTLQAIRYSTSTASDPPIDATPTDAATTGNQFRLTDSQWHFNLSTKGALFTQGTWLLQATLEDGSLHTVWISLKK